MNKKINRIEVRQTAQKAAIRDEQNRRIQFAATHPTQETLGYLNTTLCGLEPGKVEENRSEYGSAFCNTICHKYQRNHNQHKPDQHPRYRVDSFAEACFHCFMRHF